MASAPTIRKMREKAICSICQQLMTEPVSIKCGHSFCRQCIKDVIKKEDPVVSFFWGVPCPMCQTLFATWDRRPNKQLENLIQTIKDIDCENLCEEHGEQLQLFCEDDGQLICWCCERSLQHREHNTALVKDACLYYKEKLQKAVTKMKEVQGLLKNKKLFIRKQMDELEENVELQRQKIQSDFCNLYNFLHEEEKCYLWRLEKEKEQMLSRLQSNEVLLEKQNLELKGFMLELEKKCQDSAQNLLQDMKDTIKRYTDVKLEFPEILSLKPQTVCNISQLYFDVKKVLRSYQVTVTLDPDTAHPELILSEDQKQVTHGSIQKKCFSLKRFCALPCVLGCESFSSGRYYFEVGVRQETGWDLGICLENVQRDRNMSPEPQTGFWAIRLCPVKGYVALTSPPTTLSLSEQPLLVGVVLDCDAGRVSFFNMTTGSHIFTFPKASFSDTLRPYFHVNHCSLFLPPPYESS